VLLVVPSGTWVATDLRRSVLRTSPDGVAGWERSLQRLGLEVDESYRSFTAAPVHGDALVILEPIHPPSAAEAAAALAWVREGGILVYSPGFDGLLLDSLRLTLRRRSGAINSDEPPAPPRFRPHRWTEDVEPDTALATWSLEPDSVIRLDWTPLAVVQGTQDPTLAWVREGSGGVLVVAEAEPLSNARLATSSTATVMTRALLDLLTPGDTVVFSEYHQGVQGGRGIFREVYALAAGTPVGRVLMQGSVVAVLLLLLSGRSFGAPEPEREGDRRSPLEHVEALGRIYQGSASDRAVARRLVLGAVRRSGQRPSGADDELGILRAWSGRPEVASPSRLAIAALRRDPPDLAGLTSALDAIVDEYAPHHQAP
jgi:hypothetical protein